MHNYIKITVLLLIIGLLVSYKSQITNQELTIQVENNQNFSRNEVVEIPYEKFSGLLKSTDQENIRVKKQGSQDYLITQWMDSDSDGVTDALLFQVEVAANSSAKYVVLVDSMNPVKETKAITFSRLVPERTDDYTWENDKVAFRTYGPEAQRRIEENKYGGTLSSGIDLWLKRVEYSIIDKWYAKNLETEGYYHIDHGEGYDPYHVGKSRGTGGLGIWENDSLYVSKNFIACRTLATGPLRTIFELDYAPWSDYNVKETKRISLDLSSNFSKFEIKLNAEKEVPNYTIGITLHDGKGEVKLNQQEGWFRHWEPINDAYVGEGIIIEPNKVQKAFEYQSKTPDQSQVLLVAKPQKVLTYYAGFAWTKSGQVTTLEDWDKLLERQVKIVGNPLKISVVE
ncbi:DUF4861 family protein [Thalassobellus suaedae]|uniref:DUF4861 family protein n=1 Tax=Thalassobellus suaedae TaxID=3074124 RepID=A0ABY9Y1B0_9FLAO|nr:DUF4861 family protein [Flavobacteriaceae bacterium HL-DH10]